MSKREAGSDKEKKNGAFSALADVSVSDEEVVKLNASAKELLRAEIIIQRKAFVYLAPTYEKRRALLKSIPKFWPVALFNHETFVLHAVHEEDRNALTYLEDVWVVHDPNEHRAFTIEFGFAENPYFSDKSLTKDFKFVPQASAEPDVPDEEGITKAALDFEYERDVVPQKVTIHWKDPAKALTKLYPRMTAGGKSGLEDPEEYPEDSGSFFNFFEIATDPFEIGPTIANDIFPSAIDLFFDQQGSDDDSEDEESDEDEDEIDLEQPRKKKARGM